MTAAQLYNKDLIHNGINFKRCLNIAKAAISLNITFAFASANANAEPLQTSLAGEPIEESAQTNKLQAFLDNLNADIRYFGKRLYFQDLPDKRENRKIEEYAQQLIDHYTPEALGSLGITRDQIETSIGQQLWHCYGIEQDLLGQAIFEAADKISNGVFYDVNEKGVSPKKRNMIFDLAGDIFTAFPKHMGLKVKDIAVAIQAQTELLNSFNAQEYQEYKARMTQFVAAPMQHFKI